MSEDPQQGLSLKPVFLSCTDNYGIDNVVTHYAALATGVEYAEKVVNLCLRYVLCR